MEESIKYKIKVPFINKKILIIEYHDNDIYFSKIIKYSLTKEHNELLESEYKKYQIISKNNLSLKYNFENFNQIINVNNVVFDSDITLDIINNNITYPIIVNTSLFNLKKEDAEYYNKNNISEEEDACNIIKKYKKIKYKFKTIYFNVKKVCFIICDYDYRKITFDKFIYNKNILMENELNCIKTILNNLEKLYEEQHFIHGDLKCDNILLLKDSINNSIPYFFDLEFSILCKQNKIRIISDYEPRINLYLNLEPNFLLLKEFFHIFDYYLFTISIISYHSQLKKNLAFISFLDEYLNENDNNENDNNDNENIIFFMYIYDKICYYLKKKNIVLTVSTMFDYCDYDSIHDILNYSFNKNLSYIEKKIKDIYLQIDTINSLNITNNIF
jgi:hypothetical protein